MSSSDLNPKNYIVSIEKAAALLELFSVERPTLTFREILAASGHSRTTCYRLLATLERVGWILNSNDHYRLGLSLFKLGTIATEAVQIRREAHFALSELSNTTGQTSYLMVPDGIRGVCLERIQGSSNIQIMGLEAGTTQPLFVGGGTLAILASRQEDLLPMVLEAGPMVTPQGHVLSPDDLRHSLTEVLRAGYSRSVNDITDGVGAFGAPVFDASGTAIAAVSVGGLLSTLLKDEEFLAREVKKAARAISAAIGYEAAVAV